MQNKNKKDINKILLLLSYSRDIINLLTGKGEECKKKTFLFFLKAIDRCDTLRRQPKTTNKRKWHHVDVFTRRSN